MAGKKPTIVCGDKARSRHTVRTCDFLSPAADKDPARIRNFQFLAGGDRIRIRKVVQARQGFRVHGRAGHDDKKIIPFPQFVLVYSERAVESAGCGRRFQIRRDLCTELLNHFARKRTVEDGGIGGHCCESCCEKYRPPSNSTRTRHTPNIGFLVFFLRPCFPGRPRNSWRVRSAAALLLSGIVFLALGFLSRLAGIFLVGFQLSPIVMERAAFGVSYVMIGMLVFLGVRRMLSILPREPLGVFPGVVSVDRPSLKSVVYGLGGGAVVFLVVRGVLEIYKQSAVLPEPSSPLRTLVDEGGTAFLFLVIASGIVTPILEEIFYRGILLGFLRDVGTPTAGTLLFQAVLFALAHTGPAVPIMVFVGLGFGILFWRQGLSSAIVAHIVYNSAILVEARWTGQ